MWLRIMSVPLPESLWELKVMNLCCSWKYNLQTLTHILTLNPPSVTSEYHAIWMHILNAHINTVLWPLICSVWPVTHDYVHKCCLTVPICVCLGEYDPYYVDSLTILTLLGVFQGAKPYLYCDTKNNQTPRVHDYSESDYRRILCYLDDNYHMGLNLETPSGRLPELSFYNELPPIPPSPTSTVEVMSNGSDSELCHQWRSGSTNTRLEFRLNFVHTLNSYIMFWNILLTNKFYPTSKLLFVE